MIVPHRSTMDSIIKRFKAISNKPLKKLILQRRVHQNNQHKHRDEGNENQSSSSSSILSSTSSAMLSSKASTPSAIASPPNTPATAPTANPVPIPMPDFFFFSSTTTVCPRAPAHGDANPSRRPRHRPCPEGARRDGGARDGAYHRLGVVFVIGFDVDDVEVEGGIIDGGGHWNVESLVPGRKGVAVMVDFGGALSVRFHPNHGVWLQRAVAPVHVLQIFGGGDLELELEARGHRRRNLGIPEKRKMLFTVKWLPQWGGYLFRKICTLIGERNSSTCIRTININIETRERKISRLPHLQFSLPRLQRCCPPKHPRPQLLLVRPILRRPHPQPIPSPSPCQTSSSSPPPPLSARTSLGRIRKLVPDTHTPAARRWIGVACSSGSRRRRHAVRCCVVGLRRTVTQIPHGDLDIDLALRAPGGTAELESAEGLDAEADVIDDVAEEEASGAYHRLGVPVVVDFGGALSVRFHPNHGVWLQRAVAPVHVLQIFGGGDLELELEARGHRRRNLGIPEKRKMLFTVKWLPQWGGYLFRKICTLIGERNSSTVPF
ncbi:unnamed protein product, partial [Vitis vinifera]